MAKAKATKEVVEAKSNAVSTSVEMPEFLGAADNIDASDLIIPKVLLMQGLSEFVVDEAIEAKAGEYRSSLDAEVLANKGDSINIVIFGLTKLWQHYKIVEGDKEYVSTTLVKDNPGLDWKQEIEGVKYENYFVYRYQILLLDEITSGMAFPYTIDFKSTSFANGKKLANFLDKLRRNQSPNIVNPMDRASYGYVFKVGAKQEEKNNKKFYIKTVDAGRKTTDEERTQSIEWLKTMATAYAEGRVQEHEADEDREAKNEAIEAEVTSGSKF